MSGRWLVVSGMMLALLGVMANAQQVVSRGNLTVTYRDPNDAKQLPLVFSTWEKASKDLKALGLSVPKVQLNAALNAAEFAQRTNESGSIAASTRGSNIHTQRLTALAARGILEGTIRHEAFHTAQPANLPRWQAEGLARMFSGEAERDPAKPTGLEDLTNAQLDARLLGRTPGQTGLAYAEATRRARALVRKFGWHGALGKLGTGER